MKLNPNPSESPETTRRVVIYARVSTDREKQATSIPAQIERCKMYCDLHKLEVVGIESDEGVSGGTMDRPGWNRVVDLIKSKQANLILSTSLDRMTRTVEGFLKFVSDVLKPLDAGFACIQESIDTSTAAGRMLFQILLVFAQFYREQVSEKTAGAMLTRAKQGYYNGTPPFGTMKGEVKGIPIKNPDTWPILEKMFEMAASGLTYTQILNYLRDHGIKSVKGGEWGHSSIRDTLTKPFYLGEIHTAGQVFTAKHKCHIAPATWHKAQRTKRARAGRKPSQYQYLLDNVHSSHFEVAFPEHCNGQPLALRASYADGRNGKRYPIYVRSDRYKRYGGIKSRPVDRGASEFPSSVRADELDHIVLQELIRLADHDDNAILLKTADASICEAKADAEEQISDLQKTLDKTRRERVAAESKLLKALDAEVTEAVRLLNQRVSEFIEEEERVVSCLDHQQNRLLLLKEASEPKAILDKKTNLIKRLYTSGKRDVLKQVVNTLVRSVDVRMEGTYLNLEVATFLQEAATVKILQNAPPLGIEPRSTA